MEQTTNPMDPSVEQTEQSSNPSEQQPIQQPEATVSQPERSISIHLNLKVSLLLIAAIVVCIVAAVLAWPKKKPAPQIDVSVTLSKIVKTSDLATSVFQYQGIVEIPNQKNLKKIDYYICYDASVYAGIDFSQVTFTENKETKTITATLPEVKILDTVVDPSSMEFMFQNKKADSISVTDVALTACETDIQQECTTDSAILDVARMNAENAVRALAEPVLASVAKDYSLVIQNTASATDTAVVSEEGRAE